MQSIFARCLAFVHNYAYDESFSFNLPVLRRDVASNDLSPCLCFLTALSRR